MRGDFLVDPGLRSGLLVRLPGDHPATGRVVAEWPEVGVPVKATCFGASHVPSPVAALHSDGTRLAIAQTESIALITLT